MATDIDYIAEFKKLLEEPIDIQKLKDFMQDISNLEDEIQKKISKIIDKLDKNKRKMISKIIDELKQKNEFKDFPKLKDNNTYILRLKELLIEPIDMQKSKEFFQTISELEKVQLKKIFKAVSELEKEQQKEISENNAGEENNTVKYELKRDDGITSKTQKNIQNIYKVKEQQKKIFEAISELEKEQLKKIFKAVLEFENLNNTKFLNIVYTIFINENKINKEFLEIYLTKVVLDNEQLSIRESVYKLYLKIKEEDKKFYEKLKLEKFEKYFNDLIRKYEIKKNKKFLLKKNHQKKRIKLFKEKVFSDENYLKLLINISKNKMYVEEYVMFDFVMYVLQNFHDKDFILESDSRFSYSYFEETKYVYSRQVMLNELFLPYGFKIKNNENSYKYISFEKLLKVSYENDDKSHNELINIYREHSNRIYIYYVLSKNHTLDYNTAEKIKNELNYLDYTYPYDDDVSTMISIINGNISKLLSFNKKHTNEEHTNDGRKIIFDPKLHLIFNLKKEELQEVDFVKLEELAYSIQWNKSNSMMQYFQAITKYLNHLISIKDNKEEYFEKFISYIINTIKNDYQLNFYYEFYFPHITERIRRRDFFELEDYEFILALEYLKIIRKLEELNNKAINCNENKRNYFFVEYINKVNLIIKDLKKLDIWFKSKLEIFEKIKTDLEEKNESKK